MKKMIFLVVALCFATASFAQKGKLNAAKNYYNSGDYKAAYTAIEAASKHEKTMNLPETWVYKAQILSALQISPTVTQLLGITVEDEELSAALDRAAELDTTGDYKEELAEAAQIIMNNSHNAGVDAFSSQQDYAAALAAFENKLKLKHRFLPEQEEDPVDYLVIGASQFELGNVDEGIVNYEKLIELKYDDPAVFNTVLNYHRENENGDQYLATLKSAQEMYPNDTNYRLLEIDHYVSEGKIDEILPEMLAASEEDPDNVNLLVTIASVYKSKDDKVEEEKWLKKAMAADSENMGAIFNLGVLYFNQAVKHNDTMNFEISTTTPKYIDAQKQRDALAEKAFPLFEKSYQLEPKDPAVLQAMVQYYRMYGKKDLQAKFQAELDAIQ